MGIRAAVANAILQWAERRSGAPLYTDGIYTGQPVYPEWSTERAIKEGYKASYIYYSGASDLADCIRSVPWNLKRKTADGAEIVDKHPLALMLRRPNEDDPWGALCEAWDIFKSLGGNGYGNFLEIGDAVKVWGLRPDRVKIVPDKKGRIDHYEHSTGMGKHQDYDPDEILHFKFFDPGSDHYGLAPLQAAAMLVDASNGMVGWNKRSVKNRARPDGMFTPKTPLDAKAHKNWRDNIQKQLSGPSNAHKIILNPFDAEFVPFELTPVEMDFIRSFETYEDAVCKVLHIHPEALGKSSATYENKRWALRAKWDGPVTSRLREMRGVFNHKFGLLYGTSYPAAVGDLYLDYDLSDTPAVTEARKEASEEAQRYWKMGVPFDAISQKLDLPFDPILGGDVGYLPVNVLPAGMPSDQGRSSRSINLETDDQFRAHWRMVDQRKAGWERGVATKVAGLFAVERKAVVKAIEGGKTDVDYVINGHRGAWEKLIEAVLRSVIEDFGDKVADDLNAGRVETGRAAMEAIAAFLDDRLETRAPYEFDPWTTAIQDWVEVSTAEHVTSITTTTKEAIRRVISVGLDEGLSMVKIARTVRQEFEKWESGTGVYRSMMIARTEVHTASSYAMHESARQSGVAQQKAWLTAGDERVRDSHMANEAEGWIDFDQAYSNGAAHPGDGPDTINCRCVEMFRSKQR